MCLLFFLFFFFFGGEGCRVESNSLQKQTNMTRHDRQVRYKERERERECD